jgi:hypothetical protein
MAAPGLSLKKETTSGWSKAWKGSIILWTISKNLFALAVIYLAFEKVNSAFETLVLAGLVLIFLNVNTSLTTLVRLHVEEALAQRKGIVGLYNLTHAGSREMKGVEEGLNEQAKAFRDQDYKYFINIVGDALSYMYVLWKFVGVALG